MMKIIVEIVTDRENLTPYNVEYWLNSKLFTEVKVTEHKCDSGKYERALERAADDLHTANKMQQFYHNALIRNHIKVSADDQPKTLPEKVWKDDVIKDWMENEKD